MNDEYLWQRTGEDPEVEKLEQILSVFRYRESKAPALAVQMEETPPRWRMSLAIAFASFAAAAILAVTWTQIGGRNNLSPVPSDLVFVNASDDASFAAPAMVEQPAVKDDELPSQPAPRHSKKIGPTKASFSRRVKPKDPTRQGSVAALTQEERYAYRQLMLALSISSSKLKIVQDAIDGTEETESSRSTNQR